MDMPRRTFKIIANNVVVFHHGYLGFLLMGWVFPINVIGLLILLDDVIEHTMFEDTPLRVLFDAYIAPQMR